MHFYRKGGSENLPIALPSSDKALSSISHRDSLAASAYAQPAVGGDGVRFMQLL